MLFIPPGVAAKVSLEVGDKRLRHEQDIFALLDHLKCPQLAQCYFRGVGVIFLELLAHGTLHDRKSMSRPKPVLHWMLQLSSAAATLEALGYAHGDINPENILLDVHDQVRLVDFDHSLRIGDALDVGYEPYVRQHRGYVGGHYGIAGPFTEQFALGSVFWYMTRGSELYSELEGHDQVNRLLDGKFPATDPNDPIDRIIVNCWNGLYSRVVDLVEELKDTSALEMKSQPPMSAGQRWECDTTRLCKNYYSLARSSLESGAQIESVGLGEGHHGATGPQSFAKRPSEVKTELS